MLHNKMLQIRFFLVNTLVLCAELRSNSMLSHSIHTYFVNHVLIANWITGHSHTLPVRSITSHSRSYCIPHIRLQMLNQYINPEDGNCKVFSDLDNFQQQRSSSQKAVSFTLNSSQGQALLSSLLHPQL